MGLQEASDFITGLNRRYRQQWEQTRLLCRLIHKVETGKELEMDLPWDDEEENENKETEEQYEQRLQELRLRAKRMEAQMNKKGKQE
jgi:hypothetical protein